MRGMLVAAGLALLLLAAPAAAQEAEVQVPLDRAGRVEMVDRALAQRLGLWVDEYPGFREARLFRLGDGSFVLEITSELRERTVRQRVPLSAAEAERLREDVAARLSGGGAGAPVTVELNQEGRYLLIGQTTLAGVTFYGWALPYVLGAEDQAAAGLYFLTAAGSFFLPFALTQGAPATFGMANLSRYGVTRGIAHGLLAHTALAGTEERSYCEFDCGMVEDGEIWERSRVALAMTASIAEGVGGYLWARNERMPAGTANAIVTGGDAGLLAGLGTAVLLGLDERSERLGATLGLAGAAGGIVGAHRLAQRRDYTWGDADLIYTGGAVGAWAGAAATIPLGSESIAEEAVVAAAMLGGAAGLYLGDRLVRGTDFSVGQASLNRLGSLAGALAGASLGALAEDGDLAVMGSALGAVLGYYGTYSALAPDARAQRGERMSSLRVQLHPEAALARRADAPSPVLSVQYRF